MGFGCCRILVARALSLPRDLGRWMCIHHDQSVSISLPNFGFRAVIDLSVERSILGMV